MPEKFQPSEKPKKKLDTKIVADRVLKMMKDPELKGAFPDWESIVKHLCDTLKKRGYEITRVEVNEINKLVKIQLKKEKLRAQVENQKRLKDKMGKLEIRMEDIPELAKSIPNRITGSYIVRSPRRISLARSMAEADFSQNILWEILKALKIPIEGKHKWHVNYFDIGIEPIHRMNENKIEYSAKLTQKQKEELIKVYILSQKQSGK